MGMDKAPIIDDREEYLNIKKTSPQLATKTIPNNMFMENSIPTYVATPLPPLNLSHIGNTCPKKAHNEAIYISSGKFILTKITGIIAFATSNIKVVYPINLLPVLKALVAPILPEPISLISFFRKILVKIKPNGIDPIKYEAIPAIRYSIIIF